MNSTTIIAYIVNWIQTNGRELLKTIVLAVGVFIAFLVVIKQVVARIEQKMQENSIEEDIYNKKVAQLAGSMVYILLMIFNILAVFQVIGFDVALIMWGISLSIWFAMETTIGNMISGVMIMTNEKVKLWDYVQFLGGLNILGTIEEITLRYTVIRTFDKRRTIIPNTVVAATPIKTLKTETLIRGNFTIKVPRHVEVDQIKSLLIKLINERKGVLYPEYTNIILSWFDTAGIVFQWFFFLNPQSKRSQIVIKRELMTEILKTFKIYGINIPYNHMTITVEG